jgi:hypothetical protein
MDGISIICSEGEFNGKDDGFGGVSCQDDDSVGGFGILIGNSEMEMHVRFIKSKARNSTSRSPPRSSKVAVWIPCFSATSMREAWTSASSVRVPMKTRVPEGLTCLRVMVISRW